jgi:hypothetical protein
MSPASTGRLDLKSKCVATGMRTDHYRVTAMFEVR